MQLLKIKDNPDLSRDVSSGAVINTNSSDYENYMARRRADIEMKNQIKKQKEELDQLKTDISEIKSMLVSLINKEL